MIVLHVLLDDIRSSSTSQLETVMSNRMYILLWHCEENNLTAYTDN